MLWKNVSPYLKRRDSFIIFAICHGCGRAAQGRDLSGKSDQYYDTIQHHCGLILPAEPYTDSSDIFPQRVVIECFLPHQLSHGSPNGRCSDSPSVPKTKSLNTAARDTWSISEHPFGRLSHPYQSELSLTAHSCPHPCLLLSTVYKQLRHLAKCCCCCCLWLLFVCL